MPFSRRSSQPRDCSLTSAKAGSLLLASREAQAPQPQRREGFSVLRACLYLHTMSFVLHELFRNGLSALLFTPSLKES